MTLAEKYFSVYFCYSILDRMLTFVFLICLVICESSNPIGIV